MNKFKNYSFLTGLISAVLMVVVQILSAFEIYISSETVSNVVSVVLGALVVLGVISKPDNASTDNTNSEQIGEESLNASDEQTAQTDAEEQTKDSKK